MARKLSTMMSKLAMRLPLGEARSPKPFLVEVEAMVEKALTASSSLLAPGGEHVLTMRSNSKSPTKEDLTDYS